MGRHLVEAGIKPGPHFKDALAAAFDAQMEGESDLVKLLAVAWKSL